MTRLTGVLGMLAAGLVLLVLLPLLTRRLRPVAGRLWARGLLRTLGVRLRLVGRLPVRAALLAANHVSWLDTLAILAVTPARLLAKREIRGWPVIGALARVGGTLFIDRDRPRTLPGTVADVAAALRAGHQIAVFPQATTTCGTAGRATSAGRCSSGAPRPAPFRPALFQAALDAEVPVVPLTLTYHFACPARTPPAGPAGAVPAGPVPTSVAAFIGDEALWPSVRRVLGLRDLVVTLDAGAPLPPDRFRHRRALARLADRDPAPARSALDLVG
ncbi:MULTISPECIES: lysophospholipid acyltransferase family protein [unclassified Solwaraspora]|uniref:lysophospholipid acyltransferase family protein n=1 Tax=unclassified Solwaraspora TaxID=2627926 RepID=UPI00248ACCAE|nr:MULTISPECIES: lysophospholipid acyltransferase family protein [unclassified Solwaraspora]WBB98111.1 lysophospholipid acyltransferase family protein [Solwaraspora sp. WMMA2059]WJK34583.1 lysophospholipid acyltransferase family protein [Solwaraspora sp. WMMA2065]